MGAKFITIAVTEDDIAHGKPKASGKCAVARSIARERPDARRIEADLQTVRWTEGEERFVYLTPDRVAGYIVAFDGGDPLHPFKFRLNEENRLPVKRARKTEAGLAKQRTADRARRRERKLARLEADETAPPAVKEAKAAAVRAELADLAAERAEVMAAYQGQPTDERGPGAKNPPPRSTYKTAKRTYGQRRLAINGGAEPF